MAKKELTEALFQARRCGSIWNLLQLIINKIESLANKVSGFGIVVGSTETVPPGEGASVTATGTKEQPILHFKIPKGDPGDAIHDIDYLNVAGSLNVGGGLDVNGDLHSNVNMAKWLQSKTLVTVEPDDGEGGQVDLKPALSHPEQSGISIDNADSKMRIFGIPSADGTSKQGVGSIITVDPYNGDISAGGYNASVNNLWVNSDLNVIGIHAGGDIHSESNISTPKSLQGSRIQATGNTRMTTVPSKFVVEDNTGWMYYRSLDDMKKDIVSYTDISSTVGGASGYSRKKILKVGCLVMVNINITLPTVFSGTLLDNLPKAAVTSPLMQPTPGGNASIYILEGDTIIQGHNLPAGVLTVNTFYITSE